MAIDLRSTSDIVGGSVKVLVYGQAGAGKTYLIRSLPAPVIFSAEGGLLSLRDAAVAYVEIASVDDLRDAFEWARSSTEAAQFETFCLDSVSEIAEVVLAAEKKATKDPRAAYGAMQDQVSAIVRAFRDLPKNVYVTAKVERSQDETGRLLYTPSMPGNKMGQSLPYFFDEVLALRAERDADGVVQRALQCQGDGQWLAKDRSGRLSAWESPDMGRVIAKIGGKND